jgi:hypothetical protein
VADAILMHWRGLTITRERAAQVGGLLVLLDPRDGLADVTMEHYNARTELVRSTARLFGAGGLLNGMDPSYMPSYDVVVRSRMNLAFNVIGLAPGLQEIGTLVAAATCWGLFFDEIKQVLLVAAAPVGLPACGRAASLVHRLVLAAGQPGCRQRRSRMGACRPRRTPRSRCDLPGSEPDRQLRRDLTQVRLHCSAPGVLPDLLPLEHQQAFKLPRKH